MMTPPPPPPPRILALALTLVLALGLSACSPRLALVRGMADGLAAQGQAAEEDPVLAREAAAFSLKFAEGVLREVPDHAPLAETVASGFTQYAWAFVAFEADRLEAQDSRAAQALRERAARLYLRAQRHAMAALERQQPGLRQSLLRPQGEAAPLPRRLAGLAYWAAASWGGHIALSKDDPAAVADLPLAQRLAERAWRADPDLGQGALTSLMGSFEAGRPGGSLRQAQALFEQALAQGGGREAGPLLALAEQVALAEGDRPAFERWLRQAVAVCDARLDPRQGGSPDLAHRVLRERALWLLSRADDLF